MHQHPKPGYLFFTPRAPNGKRLSHLRFRHHLHASENERELPDVEKNGRWQGKIEVSGGNQGKPETSITVQRNSNPTQQETANHSDPLWEPREKLKQERAEAKLRKEREAARLKRQQEVDHYVNTGLGLVDDTAAYFKMNNGQARPSR